MDMNKPVAWYSQRRQYFWTAKPTDANSDDDIPLYTHPVKEQLSNGHLSDCAIHNEPALRNKPCDCGFEPKFNLSDLKHEDDCRYFDDGEFCTCGSQDSALVEWYRHKEVAPPVKELTDEEIREVANDTGWSGYTFGLITFAKAILRKAQE